VSKYKIVLVGSSHTNTKRLSILEKDQRIESVSCFEFDAVFETSPQGIIGELKRIGADAVIVDLGATPAPNFITALVESGFHMLTTPEALPTVESVISLRRAEASNRGVIAKLSFGLRYQSSVKQAQALMKEGRLGDLVSMRAVYGVSKPQDEAIAALSTYGLHMLDLMQVFAGPFQDIRGMTAADPASQGQVDANAMALLRTYDGVIASMHASVMQWRHMFRLELYYQRGYIWLDGLQTGWSDFVPEMLIHAEFDGAPVANPAEMITEVNVRNDCVAEVIDFVTSIETGRPVGGGTTQDLFDAVNTVHRVYADDRPLFEADPV